MIIGLYLMVDSQGWYIKYFDDFLK